MYTKPRVSPGIAIGSSLLGRACLHGPPKRAHELYRHDGRLELASGIVCLHRMLEVAEVMLSRLSVPLRHPRVLQQLGERRFENGRGATVQMKRPFPATGYYIDRSVGIIWGSGKIDIRTTTCRKTV